MEYISSGNYVLIKAASKKQNDELLWYQKKAIQFFVEVDNIQKIPTLIYYIITKLTCKSVFIAYNIRVMIITRYLLWHLSVIDHFDTLTRFFYILL